MFRLFAVIVQLLLASPFMVSAFCTSAARSLAATRDTRPSEDSSSCCLLASANEEHQQANNDNLTAALSSTSRRNFAAQLGGIVGASLLAPSDEVQAAPPIAIIAEELGYFPVTNAEKETVYVPKRIQRESTEQAVQLARQLRASGAVSYTAYWCPHCARQRELWGRQAWNELRNVECAPKGYNAKPAICLAKNVDGCE